MACLDQQHSGNEGQTIVVVEDLPISDLDDFSNLDFICCLKDHNYSVVVGFVVEDAWWTLNLMLGFLWWLTKMSL